MRQAFPNCPQYIQARDHDLGDDIETIGEKRSVHRGDKLNRAEAALIAGADTLFIASRFAEGEDDWSRGVDVSHRGGKPGFVIVAHESLLLFPDYAGNCMFSTLGNIQVDPRCGLLFIDFDTGDVLQLTGEAEILWEPEHVCRFPGAERVVSFQVEEKIHIEQALPLTWQFRGFHPILDKLATGGTEETVPQARPMSLESVNVSMPKEVAHDGKTVTTLRVGAPRGKFTLDPDGERAVVLLSAGVGLTPMISMLNAIVQGGAPRPVWFIHGTRSSREHAMGAHVRRLAEEHDNVHVHIRYSEPDPEDVEGRGGRDYDSRGWVDMALLKQVLPFDDYDFFLCGPQPFMRTLYCGLLSLGMSESRIHYEFFGPGSMLTEEAKPAGAHGGRTAEAELTGGTQVTFARSGVTASWDPACASILDLAEHHGLSLPYSCRSGICHTCVCEVTEGDVEYLDEPQDEPDEGHVLICCSVPTTNLVLEA